MTEIEQWYCFKFDVPKTNAVTASELIRKMSSFMDAIEDFNRAVVHSSDETFVVTSYVEDIQTGSIRWWLVDKLHRLDDKAIDRFVDQPVRTMVASMLKKLKQVTIETLEKNDGQPIEVIEQKVIEAVEKVEKEYQKQLPQNLLGEGKISIEKAKILMATSKMSQLSR